MVNTRQLYMTISFLGSILWRIKKDYVIPGCIYVHVPWTSNLMLDAGFASGREYR